MPILVIFCLLWSTFAVGVVFNLNFNIYNKQENNLNFVIPEAQADQATTTVFVLNASPYFVLGPFEKPFSTNTTPVNVGETLVFTALADDPELNDYYLLVCATSSGAAVNGGAPACQGTQFCVSGATAVSASSTCVYTNVVDPGAETDDWYAYVCDGHATEAACSPVNQGSGDGGSPFYVNHAPTIDLVITSDNNKAPGGTFTVTASSTDTDVLGGADTIYFDICATNSWSTTTRCAVSLCYATSTISGGITATSCQFTINSVVPDQNYTYYAYIQDWHNLAGTNNGTSTYYTVINVAPIVSGVVINNTIDIAPNLKGSAEAIATSTGTVTDYNGCTDLLDATSTIYWESVSGAENCTANDNNCYKMTAVDCIEDVGSCTGDTDSNTTYTCTTQIAFYAVPTDTSARYASSTVWRAALAISDDNGAFGIATSVAGVDVETNTALDVTESGINYGTMSAGSNTGNNNATTTVVNYGNSPLDAGIYGTDMIDSPYYIRATYQEYSLINFGWGAGTDLSSSTIPYAELDVLIARPTSLTNVTDEVLWGLGLPVTTHSGDYTGTTTFVAIIDENGSW
ncbi:hypothetical protein A2331_00555 [Candidatus Falkowbacteria bacterium RIFOXYB2_FULL_34_18]|uniref:Uncharacterized protein n=1 Tax=Candidatus Falkowbacteria bacterium RIFOXYD2_FULL_34_120 TaxID=1798007 RepID=A0A1F5TPG3_9BACT|nr:MAG: hypothetical protein A2331_00555 [Candidatus Falkowbacteria bacterium RIFOXYB2_FULL_34_18]OGF29045.1 MAG: hypothetical protein A2500_01955 [Candidatus Falkowbacteria bacterium RIFOXYC12_FULL_34_55]OGF36078.1 MAG: hypothetical protein A2466_00255 [Candidatus Falkowbacteria bacterium RIFOXYC2_FULL_34_220]OGF38556.1 MAG: hypothetical protein A2515_05215 [Candidatus Falkowbacteria bacterium RIFOXYD12_FULL_34_57]OGF40699.1 MAG: hypothetical protein A2531_05655 [Candidatus Falkowbacteria bact